MYDDTWKRGGFNPFTTGNPYWGTNLLGFSIGRGSGALKGLSFVFPHPPEDSKKKRKRKRKRSATHSC